MKIMTMTAMMILTIASGRRMLMTMAVVRSRTAAVMTTCARSCMCCDDDMRAVMYVL